MWTKKGKEYHRKLAPKEKSFFMQKNMELGKLWKSLMEDRVTVGNDGSITLKKMYVVKHNKVIYGALTRKTFHIKF